MDAPRCINRPKAFRLLTGPIMSLALLAARGQGHCRKLELFVTVCDTS